MKATSLLILAISLFLESFSQANRQKPFEGTITYKVSVTTNTDNETYNSYQKQKYGDMVNFTIRKDGSFRRDFITSGEKGFDFFIYNASTNSSFTKWRNIDTIYSSDCSKNSLTFTREKVLPSETINGQPCEGYFISGVASSGQPVSLTYYYPKDKEFINPALYKQYNDFFYNKVIEEIKAPFYKLVMDMGRYTVIFDIEKIENTTVNPNIINVPTGIPIKGM